jgi:predicted lipid-binding transport protein (Tim44 family)
MKSPQAPSSLRVAVAALGWIAAMAMLLIGGIVGGTGRVALTAGAIVLLVLSVAYIGFQVWYLNRAQKGSRPRTADRDPGSRRPR